MDKKEFDKCFNNYPYETFDSALDIIRAEIKDCKPSKIDPLNEGCCRARFVEYIFNDANSVIDFNIVSYAFHKHMIKTPYKEHNLDCVFCCFGEDEKAYKYFKIFKINFESAMYNIRKEDLEYEQKEILCRSLMFFDILNKFPLILKDNSILKLTSYYEFWLMLKD